MVPTLRELVQGGVCVGYELTLDAICRALRLGQGCDQLRQQSFQSTQHLMNKPLIVGGAAARAWRGIALCLSCLAFVALGSLTAQQPADAVGPPPTLSTSYTPKPTAANSPTANANWRTALEASIALKAEIARLAGTTAATALAEAHLSITRAYYSSVLDRVGETGDVPAAYNDSLIDLGIAANRFPTGSQPDFTVVRRNLLTLLTR